MKYQLGIMAFTAISLFASCSDDDIVAKVTFPAELEQSQTTGLENYSYTIPFEVKSDTEWKIEFDEVGEEIAYAHPASGKGNATIKLYIMDNLNHEARQGTMTIVFPEDNSKNKVVTLKQKAKDASDENFSTESVGNITYGIGYGFNVVTGIGARAIKSQIIKAQLLTDENLVQKAATSSASVNFQTYTGSTVKELSNDFSNTYKINKVKGWGMEAEANAKFDVNNYSKEEYQYAMSFVDVNKERITITLHEDDWAYWNDEDEGCYTKAAYKALVGENRKYPSTNAGFKKLFDTYGTHVIRTATLGGRLTIATTINTSDISKEYDLDAFAKLSYSGIVDVSTDVKDVYKESFKVNANACKTKVSALGGSTSIFNSLSDLVGDGAKNAATEWFGSLNDDESTWTFIGLDNEEDLIPLWELVEDSERARMMKEYFESGQYANDVNKGIVHNMGVQAHIANGVPEIEVTDTHIYNVKVGENNNKTVARICYEYIPELDETAPVKVIYPVVNANVKWNMGWFVGNDFYAPRRVINTNGKIKTEEISGESNLGEATEIYIRGVRIGSTPVDDVTEPTKTEIVPYYAQAYRGDKLSDYKVVKILDNIWMMENFASTISTYGFPFTNGEMTHVMLDLEKEGYEKFGIYNIYKFESLKPEGWNYKNQKAIEAIINMLKEYNVDVVKAFAPGGCLRYNALPTVLLRYYPEHGYIEEINKIENRTYTYLRRDREWIFFLLDYDTGAYQLDYQFGYQSSGDMLTAMRLCQPIQ